MAGEKILVVDDEAEIRELIAKYLRRENMEVTLAESGENALLLLKNNSFDLMILDIMMSGIDGFEVLQKVRTFDQLLHVLIVSAREEDYDKILGLGLGADDYLTKPFNPAELTARVKSHLRRKKMMINQNTIETEIIHSGPFLIDLKTYTVSRQGKELILSAREFKLLRFFAERPGRVFTKQQIYNHAWEDGLFDENTLMVYISHLRDKIEENPGKPEFIQTVRGIGYKYIPEAKA